MGVLCVVLVIRLPVWLNCDICGDEQDGDIEYEGAWGKWKRYILPDGWRIYNHGSKVLCKKCVKKGRGKIGNHRR